MAHPDVGRDGGCRPMLMSPTGASFPGGLSGQISIRFKAADKLIIRIEHLENWLAIRFLHLRATDAFGVGLGF